MLLASLILAAYLVGAIPFGLLLGFARGVDIRKQGSGNIGATNAGRVLGRKTGYFCLALDVLKGMIPTLVAGRLLVTDPPEPVTLLGWVAVAAAAVLGHVFPVYLGFRGGKGVATTIGVALGIYPYFTIAMGAGLLGFAAARLATGLTSIGSIALAIVFPIAFAVLVALRSDLWLAQCWPLMAIAIALGLLIIVRHRSNISRLLRGEELRPTH